MKSLCLIDEFIKYYKLDFCPELRFNSQISCIYHDAFISTKGPYPILRKLNAIN